MFGPKCTGCLVLLGIWGFIFLAILGGLYWNQSVGLFEDLPKEAKTLQGGGPGTDWKHDRIPAFQKLYKQNAYNCWVAAGAYGGIAVVFSLRALCLAKR